MHGIRTSLYAALTVGLALCLSGGRSDAFSWFQFGASNVVWVGAQSMRYLSPSTFPPGSEPDTLILESMGLWNIVPACNFNYSFQRNAQDFPIDNFDGFSDTIAVPASELDPGVLGATFLVNNGAVWFDMDMLFSDLPEGVGYTFETNPTCDVLTAPTPSNGFSFLLVAVHEMGHALGLGHEPTGSEPPNQPWLVTTMNPRYPSGGPMGQENIVELHTDDRNGARFLYPQSGPSESYLDIAEAGYSFGPILGRAIPVFFTPATVLPGGVLTVRSAIENLGVTSVFNVRQGFYLSTDPVIEPTDMRIADVRWDLAFQDAIDFDAELDMPADIAAGQYYFGTIFDDLNEVNELYEDNNAVAYCEPLAIGRLVPVINDIFQSFATCGQAFTGPTPTVTHPLNMAPITWSIDNPQAGMTIDPATGVVSWPAPAPSPFPYQIFIRASNSAGSATKPMLIGVTTAAPNIVPIAAQVHSVCAGAYQGPGPAVTSPACMHPILNWSLDAGPPGMTIQFSTGVVAWPNPVPAAAPYSITIRATNAAGNGTRTWQLFVQSGGDMNDDSVITLLDVDPFVAALINQDPPAVEAADLNCDGLADGRDLVEFVELLLGA